MAPVGVLAVFAVACASPAFRWTGLHLVVLLWLGAVALALPTDRRAALVAALAVLVHSWFWSPRVYLHLDKPFTLLESATGHHDPWLRYGQAYTAVHGLLSAATGAPPDLVHHVQPGFMVLAALFVLETCRRLGSDERTATGAAALAAVLPSVVALGATESRFVLASLFQMAAVAGILRRDRRGDALAATSIGLLAHLRPLQIAVAAMLWGWAAVSGRTRIVVAGGVWVTWRLVELGGHLLRSGDRGGATGSLPVLSLDGMLVDAGSLLAGLQRLFFDVALWDGSAIVVLDPTRTPIVVGLLAMMGVGLSVRMPRYRGVATVFVAGVLLYVAQPEADRVRFELPTQLHGVVLATAVWGAIDARKRLATASILALSFLLIHPVDEPRWVWQQEYRALRQMIDGLEPDAVVYVHPDAGVDFIPWARRHSQVEWRLGSGREPAGAFRWVGHRDLLPGASPVPIGRLTPVDVSTVTGSWGGVWPGDAAPPIELQVGLYIYR